MPKKNPDPPWLNKVPPWQQRPDIVKPKGPTRRSYKRRPKSPL